MTLRSGPSQAHSGCLGSTSCTNKPAEEESSMNVRTSDESGPVPVLRAFKEGGANLRHIIFIYSPPKNMRSDLLCVWYSVRPNDEKDRITCPHVRDEESEALMG